MAKIWTIAAREYRAMVGTKAFMLSIVMMPVIMFGSLIAVDWLRKLNRTEPRTIAVCDGTGRLSDALAQAVADRNQALRERAKNAKFEDIGQGSQAPYDLERVAPPIDDRIRIELSDRIRRGELYAFVEIPPELFDDQANPAPQVHFHAQDSGLSEARVWLREKINEFVINARLIAAGIPPDRVSDASRQIEVRSLGLFERSATGDVRADEKDQMTAIFLPMGVMMLMFMVIFLAAQPMLESVLEEKSQRIVEVLLGSANPFQLMLGKLLGTVAGSLTVFAIYFLGALFLAMQRGWTNLIPFYIFPWFVAFQILGVMFYASVFMAVGSAVSQLKEAQSMLLPVWTMMMIPFFFWFYVIREPNSTLAVTLSFFPPATPSMMVLRLATGQTIPWWQPVAGIFVSMLATLACVAISARVFRAGLLWQGKTPRLTEILQWTMARK
jgi:ABC-type Na+ efflux pump permease subunit